MTPTEHADLIERLEAYLSEEGSEVKDPVAFWLIHHALTALRTSYRDGWLGAADRVEQRASNINKALKAFEKETHVFQADIEDAAEAATASDALMQTAQDLRRNAPQEATDEA